MAQRLPFLAEYLVATCFNNQYQSLLQNEETGQHLQKVLSTGQYFFPNHRAESTDGGIRLSILTVAGEHLLIEKMLTPFGTFALMVGFPNGRDPCPFYRVTQALLKLCKIQAAPGDLTGCEFDLLQIFEFKSPVAVTVVDATDDNDGSVKDCIFGVRERICFDRWDKLHVKSGSSDSTSSSSTSTSLSCDTSLSTGQHRHRKHNSRDYTDSDSNSSFSQLFNDLSGDDL